MASGGIIVRVDSKGRVTIPLEVRRRLGLREGSMLRVIIDEGSKRIMLEPVEQGTAERFYGVFRVRRWPRDLDGVVADAVYGAWLGDT
ncbi:transcriptional regulator, AbrB family [Pyrolobus fumarii 1A]|uniref:Transcriptional regulator, AbrB family n=1 Tax=Pyrolobus fumarii (strain DSM 11204 / 1A) TaxID=694429 RepID=G0EFV5_PYRF1|nr:transcriptional regulator, AbrB family [Pyrolobus fumarii 1A]